VFGGTISLLVIATAIFAPWLAPYHPIDDANLVYAEEPPSRMFFLGTDGQGRDILSRIIFGARISLSIGLLCQFLNSMIGILLGLTAGFFGKWWDDLVMGMTNIMLSIPPLIFALAIMALLGTVQCVSGRRAYQLVIHLPHHPIPGSLRSVPGLCYRCTGHGLRLDPHNVHSDTAQHRRPHPGDSLPRCGLGHSFGGFSVLPRARGSAA